ncbi:MAG TPA: cobalamin-independent methionine synthase II family protein [Rhodopila sp.]|uniref:cobalamin-independent methionine synthase II family protein n=1 Tax=Rhodopila sp. TaxID=2480087 RepID=UPI002CC2BAEE|nr:cobalamin-independent methionine synthase II family protein [Rhodopila sp.]HVY16831.1 cobalamin-independent methionine synthase II family protein [Rhodopila sp.]
MLKTTGNLVLPTAITGSYPRPLWFDMSLSGRSFKAALGESLFREQYLDAVAAIINAQESAGLDIVTDGDTRFDLAVGGKSWFFYPIERLGGISGHRDTSRGWMGRHDLRPGKILWEVQEAYQPSIVADKLTRGPWEYTALWQVAQRLTDRPVKFGAICAPALASMLWNEFYPDDKAMILDLCDIMNAELRELAAAGCPLIQVEEPPHHGRSLQPATTDADLEFLTEAFNRQLVGVDAEIWVHTCWGNPNQQRVYWEVPSYERAMPHLLQLNADVITFECASSDGRDLALFGKYKTDKKIGIGVVNHCNTVVEPPEYVANLIRRALEFIPPERLVITTDCGFGREGLSRRIAYYKCVSLVEGTNIVRRELGLPEARVRASDPALYFGKRN